LKEDEDQLEDSRRWTTTYVTCRWDDVNGSKISVKVTGCRYQIPSIIRSQDKSPVADFCWTVV